MPARVLAVLLALMLLGSALATHTSSLSLVEPVHAQVVVQADDDQPAQPQAETASDAQALVMQPAARVPAAATVTPAPWSTHARPPPFLAGLQRPPQALRVTA